MDSVNLKEKLNDFLQRYKYVGIVVLAGLILMSLPQKNTLDPVPNSQSQEDNSSDLASELEDILSVIEGVGKVKVMLTISEGEQVEYVRDEDRNDAMDTFSLRRETVIISGSDRAETGLIQQVIPPVYLGAIIVCEGGDDPSVRLNVVNATGLGSDRITVLKMK